MEIKEYNKTKINRRKILSKISLGDLRDLTYQSEDVKEYSVFLQYPNEFLSSLNMIIKFISSYSKNKEKILTMQNEFLLYILLKSCIFNMRRCNDISIAQKFLISEAELILRSEKLFFQEIDLTISTYCNVFYFNGIKITKQLKKFIREYIYSDFAFFEKSVDEKILFTYLCSGNERLPIEGCVNIPNINKLDNVSWTIINNLFYIINSVFRVEFSEYKFSDEIKFIEKMCKK